MPYIICVNQRTYLPTEPGAAPMWRDDERGDPVAVATIEEARETAREELVSMERTTLAEAARATELGEDIRTLPESGGVIGPLPDGYVVDVQRVTWDELARVAKRWPRALAEDPARILDAYNNA
jgi:hypothetical protein